MAIIYILTQLLMAGSILMIIRSFSDCLVHKRIKERDVVSLKAESAISLIFWLSVLIAVLIFKIR